LHTRFLHERMEHKLKLANAEEVGNWRSGNLDLAEEVLYVLRFEDDQGISEMEREDVRDLNL